ncbi:phospho-N-acetylmuramoyl-pentapeptide-transferase [bacterium 1XD42-8]|jgi:phospho-N-acetylmuramoyl-pentapeptide-transferase|nr:phospho-N-acetylmuramoyl-pentapeptide-transferase [Lachnospiraceae bacterium]RKJ45728.1 phospho-N-acetylmuramoyl-pentapeptide-transferase [bacterium 1XD42-8]
MEYKIVIPTLIAFAVSVVLSPIVIPYLRRLKVGQTVREDGPQTHLKKSGTPTMGGVIILAAVTIASLLYLRNYPKIIPVLFATLGFGLIGFLDDYIKVVMKRSMGLRAWQKMVGEILVTSILYVYIDRYTDVSFAMRIPFVSGQYLSIGVFTLPFFFVVILGTVNGANFTDGLDGLASSVTVLIATFFTVVAIGLNSGIEPITCAVVGALLGFLLFNVHPAAVFMGDTGSLALGGFVAAVAYMMQLPLFILIVAFIYLAEVCSVIIQVCYFKITGGKRFFKMAPVHHHFEISGWAETKVVALFSIVTAVLCLVGLLAL